MIVTIPQLLRAEVIAHMVTSHQAEATVHLHEVNPQTKAVIRHQEANPLTEVIMHLQEVSLQAEAVQVLRQEVNPLQEEVHQLLQGIAAETAEEGNAEPDII